MFNCMYSNCTLYPYLANVFYATRQPVHIYLSLFLIMMIAPYVMIPPLYIYIFWIVTNYDIIYFTSLYSLLFVFATVLTHTFKTILYIFTYHYF